MLLCIKNKSTSKIIFERVLNSQEKDQIAITYDRENPRVAISLGPNIPGIRDIMILFEDNVKNTVDVYLDNKLILEFLLVQANLIINNVHTIIGLR